MSESPDGAASPQRMKPPFPSRRELHGGRIPKLPAAETPDAQPSAPPAPTSTPEVTTQTPNVPADAKEDVPPTRRRAPAPATATRRHKKGSQRKDGSSPAARLQFAPVVSIPAQGAGSEQAAAVPVGAGGQSAAAAAVGEAPPQRVSPYPKRSETKATPVVTKKGGGPRPAKAGARRLRTVAILVLIAALVGAGGYWAVASLRDGTLARLTGGPEDYPGPGNGSVEITVEPGDLGTTIGNRLYDQGVVKSVEAFTDAFEGNKASAAIKPGTYTLRKEMSASEALAALLDEKNRVDNVITVNPGQTVGEIQEKMVSVAGFSADEVAAVVKNPKDLGLPASANGKLEGWLWPGSYEVAPEDTPTTVFAQMVAPTTAFMEESGRPEADWEPILTKASIIEREVNWDEHMPKVARVIENRLANPSAETLGMLQMDSTVNYGVGKTGGIPTDVDFANDNPYNTYLHAGLPPTPIASPSLAALEAALDPPAGDWLYFVTVNLDTGETLFTDSFDEMKKNTEQLTKWCAENPGKC